MKMLNFCAIVYVHMVTPAVIIWPKSQDWLSVILALLATAVLSCVHLHYYTRFACTQINNNNKKQLTTPFSCFTGVFSAYKPFYTQSGKNKIKRS